MHKKNNFDKERIIILLSTLQLLKHYDLRGETDTKTSPHSTSGITMLSHKLIPHVNVRLNGFWHTRYCFPE